MTHEQQLPDRQRARLTRASTPAQQAAGWATWHAGELAAVLAPSALAVVATPWAWVLTAASSTAWAVHEIRQTRSRRALQNEQATKTGPMTSENGNENGDDVLGEGEIEVRHG